jgi:hypothetical protein
MKIEHRFEGVLGDFDTRTGQLACVANKQRMRVDICFKENFNIPVAQIKLYYSNLYEDSRLSFKFAKKLGDEIARRWNEFNKRNEDTNESINCGIDDEIPMQI